MANNTQTAKLQFLNEAGVDIVQTVGIGGAVQYSLNQNGGVQVVAQPIAANGAINPRLPGYYVITKGSIASLTLAAPTATVDDGLVIEISANTAFAHLITATGLLLTGTAAANTVTYPTAGAGGTAYFTAYQGKWIVGLGGTGVFVLA
jgi:hypothetical protein